MFLIDPQDPLHPRLIGEPARSLGDIPVSVAYSPELNTGGLLTDHLCVKIVTDILVCVVNGGNPAGVTCFSVDSKNGLHNLGPMRVIPQPEGVAPPPVGPLILVGDITFNPSSSAIFTTISVGPNNGPGSLFAYPTIDRQVGYTPVSNTFNDVVTPFSLNFLSSDTRLFVTNPTTGTPGAALLDISSLRATAAQIVTIPDQFFSCWVADAPTFDTLFVIDAGKPTVTIVDRSDGKEKAQFNFTTPTLGAMDTKVDRNFLYFLTDPFGNEATLIASPQVLVYDIKPVKEGKIPTQVQSFDIFKEIGQIPGLMGLAIYPATDPS
jgi:hypothetical protein